MAQKRVPWTPLLRTRLLNPHLCHSLGHSPFVLLMSSLQGDIGPMAPTLDQMFPSDHSKGTPTPSGSCGLKSPPHLFQAVCSASPSTLLATGLLHSLPPCTTVSQDKRSAPETPMWFPGFCSWTPSSLLTFPWPPHSKPSRQPTSSGH